MSTQVPSPPNTDESAFSAAGAADAAIETTATTTAATAERAAHAATVGRDHEDDVKGGIGMGRGDKRLNTVPMQASRT